MKNVLARKLRQVIVVLMVLAAVSPETLWEARAQESSRTQLHLVSVGSGDSDNITLRAVDAITRSHIIFCDKEMTDKFPTLLQGKEIHDPGFGIFDIFGKTPEEAKKNKRFDYEEKMKEFNEAGYLLDSSDPKMLWSSVTRGIGRT